MRQARQFDVVDELAQALREALDAAARHRRADVALVLGDGRDRRGLFDAGLEVDDVAFHRAASWRWRSTSQIASTMAW